MSICFKKKTGLVRIVVVFSTKILCLLFYGCCSMASRLQCHYKETVHFFPLSSKELLVPNWSTLLGWKGTTLYILYIYTLWCKIGACYDCTPNFGSPDHTFEIQPLFRKKLRKLTLVQNCHLGLTIQIDSCRLEHHQMKL